MQQRNTIRLSIVLGSILLLAILGFAIYTITTRAGKIQVNITVYPEDASILVDNKAISSSNPYLTPGKHTFSAKKKGFLDTSQTLSISDDIKSVILLPTPDSDDALAWAEKPDVSAMRETLGGQRATIRGMALAEQYPLMDKLPYIDINGPFAIDYGYKGEGNSEIFFIIHDSTPNGRKAAFEWIRKQGVDPVTIDIRYDEYQNPLTGGAS
jgi:hypothetical protein